MGTIFNADIIIRNGSNENFDPTKLRQGEPAVSTDTEQFFVGLGNSKAIEIATKNYVSQVNNGFSNAAKGKVSGELLKIDDISPITHSLKIKAQIKNLIDFQAITANPTYNQVEIIDNGFRIVGKSYAIIKSIPVLPNTNYHLSYVTNNISGEAKLVSLYGNNDGTLKIQDYINGTGGTFNSGNNYMIMILFFASNSATSQTVEFTNIQLELGTEATEYKPYVDVSGMTVRRYGKNQFNSAKKMIASFGKAPEYIENGFRVINKGVTSQVIPVLPNTDYNLSYILTEIEGTTEKHVTVYRSANGIMSSAIKNFENDIGGTFNTGNNTAIQIRFFGTLTNSDEGTVEFTNIQLELGTEATEYEPYAVIEAEVAEDGTVEGITSVYPTTVIFGDTPNVVFDCEYNQDLNQVINKLPQITVDSELSAESENPVQNKIVKVKLDKKLENSNGSVKSNNLAEGCVSWKHIGNGQVTTPALADNCVNKNKITDGSITEPKLSDEVREKINAAMDLPNITVDSELSDESTNPVQNKVTAKAIKESKPMLITFNNADFDNSDPGQSPIGIQYAVEGASLLLTASFDVSRLNFTIPDGSEVEMRNVMIDGEPVGLSVLDSYIKEMDTFSRDYGEGWLIDGSKYVYIHEYSFSTAENAQTSFDDLQESANLTGFQICVNNYFQITAMEV